MGMRSLTALVGAALLMGVASALAAKTAPAEVAWRACVVEPSRACVAARAMVLTRTIPTPPEQAKAIDQVLSAAGDLQMPQTPALARDAEAQVAGVDWEVAREDMRLAIATAYAKVGDFAAAKAMLPRFTNPSMEYRAVVEIAVALGRARSIAEAVALLRTERSTKDDWRAWSHAAWQLRGVAVARGEEAALLPMLQEAQAAKIAERTDEPGIFVSGHGSQYTEPLLIVAAELTAQGRVGEALVLGRAVADARARSAIVGGIAAVLARAGRTDQALEVVLASPAEDRRWMLSVVFIPGVADFYLELLGGPFPKIARPAADGFAASMRVAAQLKAGDERDVATPSSPSRTRARVAWRTLSGRRIRSRGFTSGARR